MSKLVPKPGIMDIDPYVGGLHTVEGLEKVVVLASNEGPLGASPLAIEAYEREARRLHLYPDGSAEELRAAIGQRFGLNPAHNTIQFPRFIQRFDIELTFKVVAVQFADVKMTICIPANSGRFLDQRFRSNEFHAETRRQLKGFTTFAGAARFGAIIRRLYLTVEKKRAG